MTRLRASQHCQGFTITEILVGVAISTLMVALMLPAVNRSRSETRTLQGLNNLQQIGQAVHLYAVDNYNTLPIGYWDGLIPAGVGLGTSAAETDWQVTINAYLTGGPGSYADVAAPPAGGLGNESVMLDIFQDPGATFPSQGLYHYMGHPLLMPDQPVVERKKDPARPLYDTIFKYLAPYKLSRFRRPHEVVLVVDGIQHVTHTVSNTCARALAESIEGGMIRPPGGNTVGSFSGFYDETNPAIANNNNWEINPGPNVDTGVAPIGNADNLANIRWRQRNDSAANFLFSDGHSETMRRSETDQNGALIAGTGEVLRRHFRIDK